MTAPANITPLPAPPSATSGFTVEIWSRFYGFTRFYGGFTLTDLRFYSFQGRFYEIWPGGFTVLPPPYRGGNRKTGPELTANGNRHAAPIGEPHDRRD